MRGATAPTSLLRRIRAGEVAGVLLTGENVRSRIQVQRLTRTLQDAASGTGVELPLVIAVDQEGGSIRRFADLPPAPSASEMGTWSTTRIRRMGRASGRALRAVGVNLDLAPVADVPTDESNFLGSRAFGTDPARVSRAACAFARGLRDAGVVPTLKHFPGLGGAGATNTDFDVAHIGLPVTELRRDAAAYAACGDEPGTLAMISNAVYPRLTGGAPAPLSRATYALARRLGEPGPFITDSLDAAAIAGRRSVPTRAVVAGADLLLFTVPASAARAYRELVSAQTRGVLSDATLAARVARVRLLRTRIRASGP